MPALAPSDSSGFINDAENQGAVKEQLGVLVDMLRQIGGNANVVAGALEQADPLSSPFTLYVNPYIGSDNFVGGSYNSFEAGSTDEEIIASKLKRIEKQRLECGYTPYRPFKSINRAAIEAAIITSKEWYTYSDPKAHVDCVTIVLSGGVHIVYNNPSSSPTGLASWGESKTPTIEELIAFNPVTGGVLLPRGCSMYGQDLRKTTIRPSWVPAAVDEAADYSNRRAILKISGTGFFFNATAMDKVGHTESVHLLDVFQPGSKAELDAFYLKIASAVGSGADLANGLLVTRPSEHEIVGPINQAQAPTSSWDTTAGASPYIFNFSVRSGYGMGGAFWDGDKISGLKSMVCANFTGTNQQKDLRCWQVYEGGNWVTLTNSSQDYQKYIDTSPDNLRRNPARTTRHISAINDAYIQKVSIFGIGQGEVTLADNGGEITDNGGNSTFGGCSAIAKGYKRAAFAKDKNWTVGRIRVPLNLSEKLGNLRRIYLGVVASVSSSGITLTSGLAIDASSATTPAVLLADGYTLASGSRIWIDNPNGPDWRATLTGSAWSSSTPAVINTTGEPLQATTNAPAGTAAVGRRVYIRRVVDTRSVAERRVSLLLNNTASARLPQRDSVLQTDPARSGGAISRVLAPGGEEVLIVSGVGVGETPGSGVAKTAEITIRRGAPSKAYDTNATFYRQGTVVRHQGKHWQAKNDLISSGASPDPRFWGEVFVHMPSAFNPEDPISQETPILVLDTDTSDSEDSTTLGINWTTAWTAAGPIRDQYRASTDYLGAYALLRALGFTESAAHNALVPKVQQARELDPSSSLDFPVAPAGGAATGLGSWAVEFRRPSTIRLYNHQWEWAGYGNYSKAMPAVQQDMSEFNKFTYYFTNAFGGRVVPKGSNEDGYEVSPRGLEDIATGSTISPEDLGGLGIDDAQRTDFPNGIQVGATALVQDLEISGLVTYSDQSLAKTTRNGAVQLASYEELTETTDIPIAGSDASIEALPHVVTIGGLNRWTITQSLINASTDVIPVYVRQGATNRNLDQMLENPPTDKAFAVPTLARAAEYANAIIGSGNRTAEIRIAAGLYSPGSVWECNVKFVAWNADHTAVKWASNSLGTNSTPNNYFDGTGYYDLDGFDDFTCVNFHSFAISLDSNSESGGSLQVNCIPLNMRFARGFDFEGGFHFLGLPHVIRAVAEGRLAATDLVYNSTGFVYPPTSSYTTNTTTNVDTLLNEICKANNRNPDYRPYTASHLFVILGGKSDTCVIRDCVFGPGLPSRKDSLGGTRGALIAIYGDSEPSIRNIYIAGATKVTTAGMFAGVAGTPAPLPQAGNAHYGASSVTQPWEWRQSYHTFIGVNPGEYGDISLRLGGGTSLRYNLGSSFNTFSYYRDGTGKLLPNHIHLVSNPYFDQFIHAPANFNTKGVWQSVGETTSTPGQRLQGFVGSFGANSYNSTKTRGVLGGNIGVETPETGFTFSLSPGSAANNGKSIFQVAGIAQAAADSTARPDFDSVNATAPGEGYPTGDNPVITSDGSKGINVALRSYKLGISVNRAITIPSFNTVL